jgi:hypothetical protein
MNKTPAEAKAFALAASEMVDFATSHGIDVGVAPTFVCLETVKENINPKCIVAAQNVNEHDHGAYTGEVSIPMLKAIGISGLSWAIVSAAPTMARPPKPAICQDQSPLGKWDDAGLLLWRIPRHLHEGRDQEVRGGANPDRSERFDPGSKRRKS